MRSVLASLRFKLCVDSLVTCISWCDVSHGVMLQFLTVQSLERCVSWISGKFKRVVVLSPACMAPNIIKVCMMYWLWCDCERSCGSPSGSFLLRIFLKSACPLDGSQCSRAIWTWKSCDLERRLVIQSYLCKNALVYAIRRFMICKRVINCALVIIFALFQNIVLSFDVENFHTRGQVSGLKILPLILRLISAERFWNARYLYDKCAVELRLLQFR